jgi:hypothetical protein
MKVQHTLESAIFLKKYHLHAVQAMAFSKMTNKVSAMRLDFSQNLSEVSYLFGANCQSLIFNFFTSIRRSHKYKQSYQNA